MTPPTAPQFAALQKINDSPALNRGRLKLPKDPNAHDVLMAIGQLGGLIKHNGAPGWLVLRRGLTKLEHQRAEFDVVTTDL